MAALTRSWSPVYLLALLSVSAQAQQHAPPSVDELVRNVGGSSAHEDACVIEGRVSACIGATPEASRLCLRKCLGVRDAAIQTEVENASTVCEQAYIRGNGKGTHECRVAGAMDDRGDDLLAVAKQVQAEADKALEAKDGAVLDRVIRQLEALERLRRQRECTTSCRKRGPELHATAARAPALIIAYKRCMVNADATHEARKLAAFERDLYCDYLSRANAKCRAANRCDWIEEYVAAECTYVSPAIGECDLGGDTAE